MVNGGRAAFVNSAAFTSGGPPHAALGEHGAANGIKANAAYGFGIGKVGICQDRHGFMVQGLVLGGLAGLGRTGHGGFDSTVRTT